MQKLYWFVGLRYSSAKKRDHSVALLSAISVFGIALGVALLLAVLSVMNGFDR